MNRTINNRHDFQNELEKCSFIKTVLMLIVVIYHGILFWSGKWFTRNPAFEAAPLAWTAAWLNSFHIYGFTLVSGYIYYHLRCNLERYRDYKLFLINKAKRLLVPYAFVAFVWVVPFQCCFLKIGTADVVKNYVLGTSPSQLWFLLMLFGVFAIMWPLSDFLRRQTIIGGAVVVGLYLIGMVGPKVFPNLLQMWTACQYCLYFWMGMKLCQYGNSDRLKVLEKIPVWLWLGADIALYSAIRLVPESNIYMKLLAAGLNVLLNMIGSVMSFVVLGKLSAVIPWKNSKLFSCISKYSFPIYLFHQQLIFCVISLLNGKINPYVNAFANVMLAFIGSLFISWVLMRFDVTRLLLGEKTQKKQD